MSFHQQLAIAGMTVDVLVRAEDPVLISALSAKYNTFVCGPGGQPSDLEVVVSQSPEGLPQHRGEPIVRRAASGVLVAVSRGFTAAGRPQEGGHSYAARFHINAIHPVENTLRLVVSERLRSIGGAMFHAAGLVKDKYGYLFPGVSGAGKSTLAMKAGGPLTLSDEMPAVIYRAVKGKDGTVRNTPFVCATPFFGDMGQGERTGELPLRAICLLEGKGAKEIAPAPIPAAVQRLLATAVCYGPDETASGEIRAICESLAKSVPVFILTTTIDEPYAQVISRIEAAVGKG